MVGYQGVEWVSRMMFSVILILCVSRVILIGL